jgi:hypothetical protein
MRGSAVLDPIMLQDFSNTFVNKRGTIITNDFVKNFKPCDNVFTDEVSHDCTNCLAQGNGLNPL